MSEDEALELVLEAERDEEYVPCEERGARNE